MRRTMLSIVVFLIVSLPAFLPTIAAGFDLKAHRAISRRAVQPQISNTDDFLKFSLGTEFPNGIEQAINGKTVRTWIEEGSQSEDSPLPRVLAHFHNPTRTWDTAGLGIIFESGVVWAQDRAQRPGGNHSWQDARESYFKALTGKTKDERDQAWAETFESLGHLIHLIQDAASPAHTRNDPHISALGDADGFHVWAEKGNNLDIISGMLSKPFNPSILTLTPNPLAPVPIARIIDTEDYRVNRVPRAGDSIGMAEYSNANFFSDDTIFSDFPFPNDLSVRLGDPEPEPKTGELRRYFRKIRDGETLGQYRLAVPSALFETLEGALADQEKGLDDNVFEDYGDLLIPRSIGYSAGLLDYFFRGSIGGIGFVDGTCFNSFPFRPTEPPELRLSVITNDTPAEETGMGEIVAVLEYRSKNLIIVSQSRTITLTRNPQEVVFDFSNYPKIPDDPIGNRPFLTVIYRGPLGLEQDSVTVSGDFPIALC